MSVPPPPLPDASGNTAVAPQDAADGAPSAAALAAVAELVPTQVQVPRGHHKVYKDECMFSFGNARDENGVYVNLRTFQAFSPEFVPLDSERKGQRLYLHVKWNRVLKDAFKEQAAQDEDGDSVMAPAGDAAPTAQGANPATDGDAPMPAADDGDAAAKATNVGGAGAGGAGAGSEAPKVTKMAIGVEGGFQVEGDKYRWDKKFAIVIAPELKVRVAWPCDALPELLRNTVEDIIARTDAKQEAAALVWSEGEPPVSKYAENLVQLPTNGKTIPPSGWKCEMSGDTENLWLNLSTGYIGGGRKYFDGTGGSGGALEHFEATGKKYPLVVKLGTITARGADVYSYADDEDKMVKDPWLVDHLKHWGIDAMSMKKTAKTMDELSIEANLTREWGRLSEGGKKLEPLAGPGLVGLENIGNSCYFNSVVQCLFSLPEFKTRYLDTADAVFRRAPADPANDTNTQLSKLAVALLTDKYVPEGALEAAKGEAEGGAEGEGASKEHKQAEVAYVEPTMVKTLLGKGHPLFSTNQQQDAQEYLSYLFEKLETADRVDPAVNVADCVVKYFKFKFERRLRDDQSGHVKYTTEDANMLSLDLPDRIISNAAEYNAYKEAVAAAKAAKETYKGDMVYANISFDALLGNFFADTVTDGYKSPVTGNRGTSTNRTRMQSYPKYLWLHLRKYRLSASWTPEKLDSSIDFPMDLDLSPFKATGLQEGETELKAPEPEAPTVDEAALAQLLPFGFSENACRRALLASGNNSEAASAWLMDHMADPDFNDPIAPPSTGGAGGAPTANPDDVAMLVAMLGVSNEHAAKALNSTGGSLERAADWALSHPDVPDEPTAGGDDGDDSKEQEGVVGKYKLKAVVSHIGTSPSGGHYVCHVLKDGVWAFFNDASVAKSEEPPLKTGFMYLYERVE